MKAIERVSIARVFSDLVKADRIIDMAEMEYWRKICQQYSITNDMEIKASAMSLADAMENIRGSEEKELRESILRDCRKMTLSDGFCAHPEALIMTAMIMFLDSEQAQRVDMISVPKSNFNIEKGTVLYVESEYNEDINKVIASEHRYIFKELQLIGFHFIYLPKIIAHYRNTDSALFREILSFLAPRLSPEGIETTYNSLLKMNTASFCKDVLCNKIGISELRDTYPALLIKISDNYVGETEYANYLKIEADDGIVYLIRSFVDMFCAIQRSDNFVINTSEETNSRFHYYGFYKQLLDIFLIRRNIRSTIHINPFTEEISFPEIDMKLMGLHRRERALYVLLLCMENKEINFNMPRNASDMEKYNRKIQYIRKCYSEIYEILGGKGDSAPDLSIPEIRRPIFSCLKKALRTMNMLYNKEDYNITKDSDGSFNVHIERDIVYVKDSGSGNPVPLRESELYKRILQVQK